MSKELRPVVIKTEEAPLKYFKRPSRTGVEGRYEPGDGFLRLFYQDENVIIGFSETRPGESFQVDLHPDNEFLYIVEGELTLFLPELNEAVTAKAGDFVHNLPGMQHQTINRGGDTLKILFFTPMSGEDGVGGVH